MADQSRIFFASDFHLGLNAGEPPIVREKRVVAWLEEAAREADQIYLLGDVFDFWWEYRLVVPKGFTRFLGVLSAITDSGIPVHFFTGNHDMWVGDYLSEECGVSIHTKPLTTSFNGRTFHLAHGEGLGTQNTGFKILLGIFRNKPLRVMYSALHPSIGVGFGHRWSLSSRLGKGVTTAYMGEEKEDLVRYSRSILANEKIDYFIYGHRHLAMSIRISEGAEIIYLGDWITSSSFAAWDGNNLTLRMLT